MTDRQILVRGTGRAETAPDFATITLSVRSFDKSREAALEEVAHRCAALDALIDDLGDAVSNRVTASVRVAPRHAGRHDERVLIGYDAHRRLLCEVHDFSVLGELLRDAAVAALADADGPHWRIGDDNSVLDEARRNATADARRRADGYAEGLGVRIGPVAWIAEPGLRQVGDEGRDHLPFGAVADMPAAAPRAGGEETIDVVVDRVVAHSTVEVAFLIAE